jgi:MFS family permease
MTKTFTVIWFGQAISMLGSGMTWFALTIWAWQKTGQATTLSTMSFLVFLPSVLLSPVAGVFVDRWNRKKVMLASDATTALGTLAVFLLYANNQLEIWHIYIVGLLAGFFMAMQFPAFLAATTLMLPKEQYVRAQGMLGLSQAISSIFAPICAAALLGRIGMQGIMALDLATFLFAFITLLWAHIPNPPRSEPETASNGEIRREIIFGFNYIQQRANLRNLIRLFMAGYFFLGIGSTLIAPLVLSQTGNDETLLASVQSVGAVGGLAGGILLSVWGGPQRRIHGVLLGGAGACFLGLITLGAGTGVLLWMAGSFFFAFFEPIVDGSNLSIWQTKVDAGIQGRVFSARQLMVQIPFLLGIFLAGPLAEYQAGIPLTLILSGFCGGIVFLSGYLFHTITNVENP